MSLLRNITSGLRSLFRKEQVDRDLNEELGAYLEMEAAEKMKQGMSRKDALREVRLERGTLEVTKEIVRSAGWESFAEACWRDLRFASRILRKSPGFTAIAVLTLALGIGSSTAIFSVVESVLWRPLAFPDSERLTAIWSTNLKQTWRAEPASPADFLDWRAQSTPFEQLAAFDWGGHHTLTGNGDAESVFVMPVSANFFNTLQVRPTLGRAFLPGEDQSGKNRVVLMSHSLWERRFHSDATLIGKDITLEGEPYAVAGVWPSDFHVEFLGMDPDLFIPLTLDAAAATNRTDRRLGIVARLKPGISLARANSEMKTIAERLAQQYPKEDGDWRVRVENLRQSYTAYPTATSLLFFFLGAVALLFLIACTNVANLLLSRGLKRQREFAVRTVLGAERKVLLSQLLAESLLLALCAGAIGMVLANWGVGLFTAVLPQEDLPRAAYIRLDGWVFAFAIALTFATTILFGLIPALFSTRVDPNSYLKEGARGIAGSSGQARVRNTLVAAQVAIALVLLFGAGLFVNSFLRLEHVSLGFDPSNLLSMRFVLSGQQYSSPEKVILFYQTLLEKMRALPGVRAAAAGNAVPLTSGSAVRFVIAGRPRTGSGEEPFALNHVVSTDYFHLMKIRLLAGRAFDEKDSMGAPRVAIVNENFVRHFFPSEDPLGKELEVVGHSGEDSPRAPVQLVGVVANTKEVGLNEVEFDSIYFPFLQNPTHAMYLVLCPTIPGSRILGSVRKEVQALDKNLPVYNISSMDKRVADSLRGERFNLLVIGSFAVFAVLLASVGIYGSISHSVEQRTQEFGIRMALGASREAIYALTLRNAGALSLAGLSAGVGISLALGRIAGSRLYLVPHEHNGLLYGVSVFDPLTLAMVFTVLTTVALLASFLPARRASRVDPLVALHYE
jgi:putative ABC transport system permease protein